MHNKKSIIIFSILFLFLYLNNTEIVFGQNISFNTNSNQAANGTEPVSNSPLFDISNIETNNTSNIDDPNWANNPFFKKETPMIPQQKKIEQTSPELSLFEYKISAIWEINNKYKALISGHIVKPGDKINEIKIKKISKNLITVERKSRIKTFRLGFTFYDFQI
jgi:hypothetical protein